MGAFTVWLIALGFTFAVLAISYFFIRSKKPDWLREIPKLAIVVTVAILFATLTLAFPTEALYSSIINQSDPVSGQTIESTENPVAETSDPPPSPDESGSPNPTKSPSPETEGIESPPEENTEGSSLEPGEQDSSTDPQIGTSGGRNANTPMTVQIEIDDNSQIGLDTWRAVHTLRTWVNIFDQYGDIENDCYASIKVTRAGESLHSSQASCVARFGLDTRQYGSGDITIRFDIETEWGATGSAEKTITIVTD
ncbi:hypothetical protein [Nocardiopsis sp. LOL_012]|uniref:hypothetical protein n=1 Tax=Nocardiopsis sp. LOL_012 TaxID=3345409 RepID=UPI003A8A1DB4